MQSNRRLNGPRNAYGRHKEKEVMKGKCKFTLNVKLRIETRTSEYFSNLWSVKVTT
jgi:hypothetical protein